MRLAGKILLAAVLAGAFPDCAGFWPAAAVADAVPTPPAPASKNESNAANAGQTSASAQNPHFNIDAFDVDGNTLLDGTDVESAVYPFAGPDRARDDVAAARDALEKAYRAKGFATVVVEVPRQDVRTGIVRLHVVEVPLGRLRIVGAQYNLPSHIKEQVPSLAEGKVPNFKQAESELAQVNRMQDVQVTPVQRKGSAPGTIDVDLKVKDTLPLTASATVNNDHAQNTSQLRTIAAVSYGNLWQLGHTISGTAILAPLNLADTEVVSGSYTAPIPDSPWSIMLSGYTSNSDVSALSGTGVLGKGFTVSLSGTLQLPPVDDFTETATFGIDFKHSLQSIVLGRSSSDNSIDYAPLNASYSVSEASENATLSANGQVTLGLRGLGSGVNQFFNNRAFARADFAKLNLDFSYLRNLFWDMQMSVHLTGQLADQPLLPNEEFSAGGLNSLRGYLQSEALGDEGYSADVELLSPSLVPYINDLLGKDWIGNDVLDNWRFFIFSDNAAAWVLDTLPGQRSVFPLNSIGVGSQISLLSHFSGNVLMGMPMRNGVATRAWHPTIQFSATTEF